MQNALFNIQQNYNLILNWQKFLFLIFLLFNILLASVDSVASSERSSVERSVPNLTRIRGDIEINQNKSKELKEQEEEDEEDRICKARLESKKRKQQKIKEDHSSEEIGKTKFLKNETEDFVVKKSLKPFSSSKESEKINDEIKEEIITKKPDIEATTLREEMEEETSTLPDNKDENFENEASTKKPKRKCRKRKEKKVEEEKIEKQRNAEIGGNDNENKILDPNLIEKENNTILISEITPKINSSIIDNEEENLKNDGRTTAGVEKEEEINSKTTKLT
uniref:Uncharacterized protein n=1 Tax=Meloidogyne incognita TaxID=6306 RepID=A0A914MZG8_MELIC